MGNSQLGLFILLVLCRCDLIVQGEYGGEEHPKEETGPAADGQRVCEAEDEKGDEARGQCGI